MAKCPIGRGRGVLEALARGAPGARENEEAYGRLGVLANWRCETKILFDISPAAFVPQPKVTSSVVRLAPRPQPEPCDRRVLEQVTAAAFNQRRKMLRQSLKSLPADPLRLRDDEET